MMPPQNPDEVIEHLRRENATLQRACDILNKALRTVDYEVDRAAAKFLSPTVQTGHLKFAEFMELLVREVKVTIKKEIRDDSKVATALSKDMREIFEERMEAKLQTLIPVLKGKLSNYITLRVIVQKKSVPNIPFARFDPEPVYYAMTLRGNVKQGLGTSPGAAYADLREKLVLSIFSLGPQEFIRTMFQVKTPGTLVKYEQAKPILIDDLEGFKVEVRLFKEAA